MADGDEKLEPVLRQAGEIALPAIVLGEYRYGVRQSRNRKMYERWLLEVMSNCRILSVDRHTAEQYADIRDQLKRIGRPIPGNDLWIAALVRQHGLPLLSRDTHFDSVADLKRITW